MIEAFERWKREVVGAGGGELQAHELSLGLRGSTYTYPLLGEEDVEGPERSQNSLSWRVRIVSAEDFEDSQLVALREFGTEIVSASSLEKEGGSLASFLKVAKRGREAVIRVDLNMLKNISEIRRLKIAHPEIESWVLLTEGVAQDDPERLVGETLCQLTGLLAGCEILEIQHAAGESFQSVWGRLNVSRLLALESDLQDLPDPIVGAGFFKQLQDRL